MDGHHLHTLLYTELPYLCMCVCVCGWVAEARARIRMAVPMGLDRFPLETYRIQTLFAYLHYEPVVQSSPAPWARTSATEVAT